MFQKSGVGMQGFLPLTYATVDAWRRLEDVKLEPHEVQALFILDLTMLYPSEPEEEVE